MRKKLVLSEAFLLVKPRTVYKKSLSRNLFSYITIIFFIFLTLILSLVITESNFIGKATVDLKYNTFLANEQITGNLNLLLKQGELIPENTDVVIKISNENYSLERQIELKKFADESGINIEKNEGYFYVENSEITGQGKGYGLQGTKIIDPIIYFELGIKQVEEDKEFVQEIDGSVVYGVQFIYDTTNYTEKNITAEIVKKSAYYYNEQGEKTDLDESLLNLEITPSEIRITTTYSYEILGFGQDFLGENTTSLSLDISVLDLKVEQPGEYNFTVDFSYENTSILQTSTDISITSSTSPANHAPEMLQEIPEINIQKNESASINLADYFYDQDNDTLTYSSSSSQNISATVENSIATITPDLEFIGTSQMLFFAYDGKETTVSNIVIINVTGIPIQAENITNITLPENITNATQINITVPENITNITQLITLKQWRGVLNISGRALPNRDILIKLIPAEKVHIENEGSLDNYVVEGYTSSEKEKYARSNIIATLLETGRDLTPEMRQSIISKLAECEGMLLQEGSIGYALVDMCIAKENPQISSYVNLDLLNEGIGYLEKTQGTEGNWNINIKDEIIRINALILCNADEESIKKSLEWLISKQNEDGSYDGGSSHEQFINTGMAAYILKNFYEKKIIEDETAFKKADSWLIKTINENRNDLYVASFGLVYLVYSGSDPQLADELSSFLADSIPSNSDSASELSLPILQAMQWGLSLYSKPVQPMEVRVHTDEEGYFSENVENISYGQYAIQIENETEYLTVTPQ